MMKKQLVKRIGLIGDDFSINKILFIAIISFILNDYVFYFYPLSLVFSIAIVICIFFNIYKQSINSLYLILYIGVILNTRPREIHLIDLATRGSYDYYSPNMLKVAGITVSTWIMFSCLLVVIYHFFKKNKIPNVNYFLAVSFLVLIGLVGSVFNPYISVKYFISDLKYPMFVFLGFYFFKMLHFSNGFNVEKELVRVVVFFGILLGFMSVIYLLRDYYLLDFKLKYNVSVFFSVVSLSLAIVFLKVNSIKSFFIFIFLFIACIPVTRGEQLALFYSIFFAIVVGCILNLKSRVFTRVFFIVMLLVLAVFSMYVIYPSFVEFILRKLEFFMTGDVTVDKSSSIRVMEFNSILAVDSALDMFHLLFGQGFSGYFIINDHAFLTGSVDLADFPSDQIAQSKFYQPHIFISYWVLKYGILGAVLLLILHLPKKFSVKDGKAILLFSFLFTVLWQSYWFPVYAFFGGVLVSFTYQKNNDFVGRGSCG